MTSHPRQRFPDKRSSRAGRARLPWLVLASGVALTLALFWRDGLQTAENVRLAFAQEASQRMEVINREVDEDLVSLEHLARFCDVADPMARDKFQRFAAPLAAHPGVQLLAWVPRVTAEGRADFEAAARLEWSPEFQVCDRESNGELKRAAAREEYFPMLYLEPLKGNERTLGRDLGVEAAYAVPMAQAQQTGAAAITARVELPVGNSNQTGFLVFVPVLPHAPPAETASAVARAPRGFVVGAFHLAEVVRAALETEIPRGLVIQIRDLGAPEADQLVFTGGSSRAMAAAARNEPLPHLTRLRAEQEFEFASRRWRITVFAQERFVREHGGRLNWGLLLAGFGGSGLLALYVNELRSARRRVETALLESELRFSTVFHASPLAVAINRFRDGVFLDANEAFVRLYGYARHELIGHTETELRLWSRPEERSKVMAQLREQRRVEAVEVSGRRKSGECVHLQVALKLVELDGETCVVGILSDITERKQAEEMLRQFERMAATSSDLIALIGVDFRYRLVNQAYLEARQLRLTDMVGREMREILGEERFEQEARPQVERCLRGEAFEVLEWNDFGGGRRFFHHVKLTPYREPDGTISGAVMTGRDITALKQAEDALRQAQKMESIGHLAGGVAHHFNNILAAMTLNLGLLRERLRDPEADESVRMMLDLAHDAGLLVGQLLAFGRKSMLQIKPCDLRQLVTGSCRLLSPLLGERIRLEFSARGGSPWIEADRALIEQVLMNLCLNARDAMPEGGDLRIELEEMEVGVAAARQHPEARPGTFARLTVSDSGHGMDAATLERLFEPFFTTKEVGRGTGLGLATAYGIVEQHQGWIEVESELGRGTTFRVWLPAVAPTESAPPRVAVPLAPAGARTVLLVEDDPAVRRAFAAYMRHQGYRVFAAADGPDARAVWSEQHGQIDLLFTDMVMPRGENGLQLALGLRAAKPELKVILSSGYSFDLVDFSSAETAQFVRLPKPFSPEELTAALARCFEPLPD